MAIRWEDLGPAAKAQVEKIHGKIAPARSKSATSKKDDLEAALATQIRQAGLIPPDRQYRFHPDRKWKFDFAWPMTRFAVEVDGGTWNGGGHVRGKHYESDCVKGCEAVLRGWRVMHVTTDMVHDGRAVEYISHFLGWGPSA